MNDNKGRSWVGGVVVGLVVLLLVAVGIFFMSRGTGTPPSAAPTPTPKVVAQATEAPKQAAPAVETPQATPEARVAPSPTPTGAPPAPVPTPQGKPEFAVSGRILSASTNEPIEGAEITLLGLKSMTSLTKPPKPISTTHSAADGTYHIESYQKVPAGVMGGGATLMRVEAEGYAFVGSLMMNVQEKDMKRDILLPDGAEIAGRVEDSSGAAIGEAFVGGVMMGEINPMTFATGASLFRSTFTTANADGTYVLKGIAKNESLKVPGRAEGYIPSLQGPFTAGATDAKIVLKKGTVRLYGKVLNDDKSPHRGATVMAMSMAGMMGGNIAEIMANQFMDEADADGSYDLTSLPAGTLMVMVMPDSEGDMASTPPLQKQMTLAENEAKHEDFMFGGGEPVTGRAIDTATNEGLAGVLLSDMPYNDMGMMGAGLEVPKPGERKVEVVTAADGKFTVKARSMGMMSMLFFKAPEGYIHEPGMAGMPRGFLMIQPPAPGTSPAPVELRFRRGVSLSGHVFMPDGVTPAPDVTVSVTSEFGMPAASAKSAADGAFKISVEPSKQTDLRAKSDAGFASQSVNVPAEGEVKDLKLVLQKYGAISGTVTDGKNKPVADAVVMAAPAEGGSRGVVMPGMGQPQATTGVDGGYYIDEVPPVKLKVSVTPPQTGDFGPPAAQEVTLAGGEVKTDINFVLKSGDSLEGVVTNDKDEPIADVSIMAYTGRPGENFNMKTATTDKEGYYRISGLERDTNIQFIQARHPDYQMSYEQNVSLLDNPHNIILKPLVKYTLVAVGRDSGTPVANYRYRLLRQGGGGSPNSFMLNPQQPGGESHNPEGTTDLPALEKGTYRVDAVALGDDGKATARTGRIEFTVGQEGKDDSKSKVVTVKIGEGKTLKGKVVRKDDNAPVPNVNIGVMAPTSWNYTGTASSSADAAFDMASATTNITGGFQLAGLDPGRHTLVISAKDTSLYPDREYSVTIPEEGEPEELTITLAAGGTIFGKVVNEQGAPVADATIVFTKQDNTGWPRAQGESKTAKTDSKGEYRQGDLEPSMYQVIYRSPTPPEDTRWQKVEAGKEHEVNFDYSSLIHLTGAVHYKGGGWPQNASLWLNSASGEAKGPSNPQLQRVSDSAYETRLGPGKWQLSLGGMNGSFLIKEFEVAAEPREQTLDLIIDVVDVDVAVDVPADKPFPKGTLSLSQRIGDNERGGQSSQITNARKRYPDLPVSEYKAKYMSEDSSMTGESDWTAVGPGKENVLVVFLEANKRIAIGNWTPAMVTTEMATLTWDASTALRSAKPGKIGIELDYNGGTNGVAIESVTLKMDGSVIGTDKHEGWSGYSDRNNIYTFQLGSVREGATYIVEVVMRSDGGTDSRGTVYVRLEQK